VAEQPATGAAARSTHARPAAATHPQESKSFDTGSDALRLLRELAKLRDEGIISSTDYEEKKAEILHRV
jgi:hypothetical protein